MGSIDAAVPVTESPSVAGELGGSRVEMVWGQKIYLVLGAARRPVATNAERTPSSAPRTFPRAPSTGGRRTARLEVGPHLPRALDL